MENLSEDPEFGSAHPGRFRGARQVIVPEEVKHPVQNEKENPSLGRFRPPFRLGETGGGRHQDVALDTSRR